MIASEVIDFPDPDSPTSPNTSPGAMENDRLRTAATGAAIRGGLCDPSARLERDCGNSMVRSRTSSNGRTRSMVSAERLLLAHRRESLPKCAYFFGRDSGGTKPATR